MQQKILFIADYLRDISSMAELCKQYGISRKTGYKWWVNRFKEDDLDGLDEQSRTPSSRNRSARQRHNSRVAHDS